MTKPDHISRNKGTQSVILSQAQIDKLNEITDALKQAMGKNCDQWQGGEDGRVW